MKRIIPAVLALALGMSLAGPAALAAGPQVTITEQYLFAGRNGDYYTEEAYRASPVVVDLDGDGKLEVLNAAYSLVVMDAATGAEKWRINSGRDRSTPYDNGGNTGRQVFSNFQVKDIDADGKLEIIVAYGNGSISVLDSRGYFKPGWPQQPTTASLRSLAVDDLDGDGKQEIIVGAGIGDPVSVWVYRCDGTVAPGWPQLESGRNGSYNTSILGTAFSYGVFGNGITTGDMDGDGRPEVIVPTDTAYVDVYRADGSLVTTSELFGGRAWGKVAVYEDYQQEIKCENEGWGMPISGGETRAQLYRGTLGHSAAVYTDVDGDGVSEIVLTALIIDRTGHTNTNLASLNDSKYMTAFIFNQDRTRYANPAKGFDWSAAPRDLGGPLKKNDSTSMAAGVFSVPVCEDIDGDGSREILFNAYNGKLHCFSLDGTEHGAWPFTLPKSTASAYEYATPPACVDLNGDGKKEVVFASWIDTESGDRAGINGALYVVSSEGKLLAKQDLHDGYATYSGTLNFDNGVMGAPVVRDVDGDGKYEVLLNTTYYALCAYELNVTGAATPAPQPAKTAYASTQTVTVDGKAVEFQMYALKDANGNDTNYVKVRDVASVLSGTASQFNVSWDGAVNLVPGAAYVPNGSEMTTPYSGNRPYTVPTAQTKVSGAAASLDAIVLTDDHGGGFTYYKLRDLGEALGFTVGWSAETGIFVNTTN